MWNLLIKSGSASRGSVGNEEMEGRIEPDAASEVVFWNPFDSGKIDEFDTDPSSVQPS